MFITEADKVYMTEADDCFRCCIATILRLEAEDVPNFAALDRDGSDPAQEVIFWAAQRWLAARGLGIISIHGGAVFTYGGAMTIACDDRHAVIMTDGEIWHDPEPDPVPLGQVEQFYVIVQACERAEGCAS